jgi:hypothetical protein
MPSARLDVRIAPGGVGSLTAVSKAVAYSRDGTGGETPSNLYAPFYRTSVPELTEPYSFWSPLLVSSRPGSNECLTPIGQPYPFPGGAEEVSVFTDEHGEALVHFTPGDGLRLEPDAQGLCDLGEYGSVGASDSVSLNAVARYRTPLPSEPSPVSAPLTFSRSGERGGSSLGCVQTGSVEWRCFHRVSGVSGEPLAGAAIRLSVNQNTRLLPNAQKLGSFDSRDQTVLEFDPGDDDVAVIRTGGSGTVGIVVRRTLPDPWEVLAEEIGTRNGSFGVTRSARTPLSIISISELGDPVGLYQRFEAAIQLSESFANPFDPEAIAVDVTFTSPSGRVQVVPAFWHQPYDDDAGSPIGAAGWRIRFAPSETGAYSYSVAARSGTQSALALTGSFEVTPTAGH